MNKRIDGKMLANEILENLKKRVIRLRKKKIIPTLAVVQVGKDESSQAYIKQKAKTAKKIAACFKLFSFSSRITFQKLAEQIKNLNEDKKIHGIVVQRPLPALLSTSSFNQAVALVKDVDGFRSKSPFNPPVAEAVFYVLQKIYLPNWGSEPVFYRCGTGPAGRRVEKEGFKKMVDILKRKKILLIGRGETAGKPIAKTLSQNKIKFLIAYSKTKNMEEFLKEADIIISCVGKRRVVAKQMIKEGVILIGVGLTRHRGRLYGDYEEKEIKDKASYYTPTPGGIGPLNVAFLMLNLLTACEKQSSSKNCFKSHSWCF